MKSTSGVRRTVVLDLKNESLSQNLRNEGKLLHEQGKLFESLESFNKSLCVAQLKSFDIPLAYSDRSAVYLEAWQYQLCLDNIQLARDTGFPSDKMEKLNEREERCKRLMKDVEVDLDDDPWNFFKLSYPANEKLPFIVNCLELRKSESFGRYIITNQDLNPGDIVAIEEPFFKTVTPDAAHTRCTQCIKCNRMSLIPSEYSQTAMFCSRKCMDKAASTFLQAENDSKMHDIKQRMLFEALAICGSFEKLQELMDDDELSNKTIFDFDFSDPDDSMRSYNMLLSINSLAKAQIVTDEVSRYLSSHSILDMFSDPKEKETARNFLLRSYRILTVNSFGIEWVVPAKPRDFDTDFINTKLVGDGLCPFGSMFNHSCFPNIDRVFVDNKFVFYVRRPIKKGKQLFTCYGTLFVDAPSEMRQATLMKEYEFLCECDACTLDYPASATYPWADVAITISPISTVDEWIKAFQKNCTTIVKHQNNMSNTEMCKIILKNLYYLVAIAKTEPFIF